MICWFLGGWDVPVGPVWVPIEMFALAAMVPICLYSGRKISGSRALQWGFYLFYPVHLLVLLSLRMGLS